MPESIPTENQNFRILVVDDEPNITVLLSRILKKAGYDVQTTTNPKEALNKAATFSPNLVISDMKMSDLDGLELLRALKKRDYQGDFIVLTAYATVENAVEVMKEGAFDYLLKPLKGPDELRVAVARVQEHQRLKSTESAWKKQLSDELPPNEIIFAGMEHVWQQVENVSNTDATVLLEGESGTGKTLIAKVIHALSGRKGPLVALNCAAMPENLIESELFGHEKGAFTGAQRQKKGKFELASSGTMFLDEIGEMPLGAQSKLLRVLQDRVFERVGGITTIKTNARIIAATNQDLRERIAQRLFRQDLYYRLNVFPIRLPPLRERRDAIPMLTAFLIEQIAQKVGRTPKRIKPQEWDILKSYPWPGNVRELHNILERAAILNEHPPRLLKFQSGGEGSRLIRGGEARATLKTLKELEKEAIETTLRETRGHRKKTAKILGISLRSLQYKLKEYGIIGD